MMEKEGRQEEPVEWVSLLYFRSSTLPVREKLPFSQADQGVLQRSEVAGLRALVTFLWQSALVRCSGLSSVIVPHRSDE